MAVLPRTLPWSTLGTDVSGSMSAEEALQKAGLNWRVKSEAVVVGGKVREAFRANVREDTDEVFGIVTPTYQIVQNVDGLAFTDALLGQGVRFETAGALNGGRRIWLLARMPEKYHVLNDKLEPYVVFTNSHDGTRSVVVALTPVRVICENTLNLALRTAARSWSVRHVGDVHKRLEEARRTLELADVYLRALEQEAEKLAATKVNIEDLATKLIWGNSDPNTVTPIVKERRDAAVDTIVNAAYVPDLRQYWDTAWAFVNAVSDWSTHAVPNRKTENWQENRFANILDGLKILDSAYNLVATV